jgi:hypothetical protein
MIPNLVFSEYDNLQVISGVADTVKSWNLPS